MLKRITDGDDGEEEGAGEGAGCDMSFGLPVSMEGGRVTEEQKLIQTGHLTPFGGQVHDNTADSASTVNGPLENTHTDSAPCTKATPTSIQLSNDGFDGLFSDTVFVKPTKKTIGERGKEKNFDNEISSAQQDEGEASPINGVTTHSDSLSVSRDEAIENDEWMPDASELAQFESETWSSSDSEYLTDDEMGSPRKKRKRLRDLSSDEEDKLDCHVTSKRYSRKRKKKNKHYLDDGDDEMFRLRMW